MKRKNKITSAEFASAIMRLEYNKERLNEFTQATEMLPYMFDLKLTEKEQTVLEEIQERLTDLIIQDEQLLINYHKQEGYERA